MKTADWKKLHRVDKSWRETIIGDFSAAFTIPRYVNLFYEIFGNCMGLSFLELGAGNGDLTEGILKSNNGCIKRYVATENFEEAVEWLKKKGFESCQMNAESINYLDSEFDVVLSFDVMHHVSNPYKMACEMLRVSKGRILLVESNGLSIFRKLKELTPGHKKAGECSYSPWRYRSFFNVTGYKIEKFSVNPFIFAFRVPKPFIRMLTYFNSVIEHIPVLRWFCSNVWIYIEYEKNTEP